MNYATRPTSPLARHRAARQRLAAAAVVAIATLGLTGAASAQVPVNQNGRAADANPRVGSGGLNNGGSSYNRWSSLPGQGIYQGYGQFGNNVVTGNISAGFAFRDGVGYRDVTAFRGAVAGSNIDRFNRSASGVTGNGEVINNASGVQTYYGDATTAQVPSGFQQVPGTGGYVPVPTGNRLADFDSNLRAAQAAAAAGNVDTVPAQPGGADVRVDPRVDANLTSVGTQNQPRGLLYNNIQDQYGVRSLAELTGRQISPYTTLGRDTRLSPYTADRIDTLRGEISSAFPNLDRQTGRPAVPETPGTEGNGDPEERGVGPAGDPETRERLEMLDRASRPGLSAEDDPYSPLMDPARQSRQYEQLQQRLERFQKDPMADALRPSGLRDRDQQQQRDLQTLPGMDNVFRSPGTGAGGAGAEQSQRNPADPTQPPARNDGPMPGNIGGTSGGGFNGQSNRGSGDPLAGDTPDPLRPVEPGDNAEGETDPDAMPADQEGAMPGDTGAGQATDSADEQAAQPEGQQPAAPETTTVRPPVDPPVKVTSFASGMSSPTLRDMLREGERLMQSGRYATALARFDAAEKLVPNQPMIGMARATAELGAGYFNRADRDLRQTFGRHPAMLMAQVDMPTLLGKERFADLQQSLRERAETDKEADQPVFLLAFLAYGSGDYNQAAILLDIAQQRSDDPFYASLKQAWALDVRAPDAEAPADGELPEPTDDEPETETSDNVIDK